MHELSLASAIVATALRHADGRRVTAVHLKVGALRQVVPDALDFSFGLVARDTLCEGACLEQAFVPARLRCRSCAHEWQPSTPSFRCSVCPGADGVTVLAGEEFEIDSISVEASPACTTSR